MKGLEAALVLLDNEEDEVRSMYFHRCILQLTLDNMPIIVANTSSSGRQDYGPLTLTHPTYASEGIHASQKKNDKERKS